MTQDHDNSAPSGSNTPESSSAKPKKTAARKTSTAGTAAQASTRSPAKASVKAPVKTAPKKPSAKPTAAPEKTAAAEATATPKKTRSTPAKGAPKTKTAAPAPKTAATSPAKASVKAAPQKSSAKPKATPVKTAAAEKTAPQKAPAAPAQETPKAKGSAPETAAKAPAGTTANTSGEKTAASRTAGRRAKKPVSAKPATEAKNAPAAEAATPQKTAPAADRPAEETRATAREAAPASLPEKNIRPETPVKPAERNLEQGAPLALSDRLGREAPVVNRTEPPVTPQANQTPAPQAAPKFEEGGRQPDEQKDEGAPRPSSRRSRRGGRRKNKKNGQASPQAPALQDAAPAAVNVAAPEKALIPAEEKATPSESPEQSKPTDARKPEKTGAAPKPAARQAPASQEDEEEAPAKASSGKRKMFISVLSGELVEVVLAEDSRVLEYYVEMQHQAKVKGNIYKGVVSNIDANLQAAFVSYAGGVKNGFLQIDEVHPEYYVAHHDPAKGRKFPPIQKVLKPGQEILVQVVKEPAGTKGAFLTSYLSLAGRFLVLTPGREQVGVSRKVEDDGERARLKVILEGLPLGPGLGVIVRTVSTGASKTSLSRDLQFLKRLWKEIRAKGQTQPSPSLIYEELDLATRAVRDYLTDDVHEVWVDDAATGKQVEELASLLFPKKKNLVQVHQETGRSLFERFSLQKQLDQIHSREVPLPSGGRLVIDNTEALTAIDINSGRSSGKSNFEDMAFRTNIEAAKTIPLHLRLRDIGGQVVVDFIEMRDRDHWRDVEKTVRNGMKGDRARYDVGKIGPFGMLEIVRQRLGSSAISISTEPCPCCKGTGIRRNMEWQAMQSLRDIARAMRQAAANNQTSLVYATEAELAFYLLNTKRSILQKMEEEAGVTLVIRPAAE